MASLLGRLDNIRSGAVRSVASCATAVSAPLAERRMHQYVTEDGYTPLRGLHEWVAQRSDNRAIVAAAIHPSAEDTYVTRIVDIREPVLAEPRNGYVFVRRGVYRPSFDWWQEDDGPRLGSFGDYVAWLLRPNSVSFLPEAVSFRTRWEANYWHCHAELLSKLVLVERMDLPEEIPLLVSPRLWDTRFFREMRLARTLRDRNWILHDRPVWSQRLVLCIQGAFRAESFRFARDIFRESEAPVRPPVGACAPLLFVTRPAQVERHLENQDELSGLLAEFGFQTIATEAMSFWEQVERFRAARCVVMAHGAGLANLVHRIGKPTGIVELFPNEKDIVRRPPGPWLSRESNFAYRAVVGSRMSPSRGFTVPTNLLAAAVTEVLRELGGESGMTTAMIP